MPAPKFEFKSILTRKVLDPARQKGTPFTFVHCRDTKEVFFTDAEGNYINFGSILAAVMNGSLPLALPASPVAGPQGPQGSTGPQGPAGKDGASIVGPRGEKGDRGDVLIPNESELAASVLQLRSQRAKVQAALLVEIERSANLHPNHRIHVRGVINRLQKEIIS
jgi:hypothetical protein